jgi:hypothetical protein
VGGFSTRVPIQLSTHRGATIFCEFGSPLRPNSWRTTKPGTGTPNVSHVENEVVLSSRRWLDVPQTVTRGNWVEKPGLSKVDEIGWTQLMPGSGHGVGGVVAVSKFEVWGKPVPRMDASSR